MGLLLHCGAARADIETVQAVPVPPATQTWHPIPHHRLLDGVKDQMVRSGLVITDEAHALSHQGQRYFGLIQVANLDSTFNLVVGLRNSHDKRFLAGLVVGSRVTVCDNLAFSGEIKIGRKHTAHIERDLAGLIEGAVGGIGNLRYRQEARFNAYKNFRMDDKDAHDLIVQAVDTDVLPVTRLPAVLKEWRDPSADHGEKSCWRLFNAFTQTLKGNLYALPTRTMRLHGLLDTAVGLLAEPQYTTAS